MVHAVDDVAIIEEGEEKLHFDFLYCGAFFLPNDGGKVFLEGLKV